MTLGKPIGNGFPLGAVVTRPEIADAFDNGMEYFNTFGGTQAACAVGLAVLDVMRDEQLQAHALEVGARLKRGLEALMADFPIVGDVRGLGLFLGVELVRDRDSLEPAAAQAELRRQPAAGPRCSAQHGRPPPQRAEDQAAAAVLGRRTPTGWSASSGTCWRRMRRSRVDRSLAGVAERA